MNDAKHALWTEAARATGRVQSTMAMTGLFLHDVPHVSHASAVAHLLMWAETLEREARNLRKVAGKLEGMK